MFAESINAQPEGRRFAVLLAFFDMLTLEDSIPPSSTRHKDIATLFWTQAMGQHKLGEAERLAATLRRDGSPPPMVADDLASIAERHAPRPRGRPKRSWTRFESIHQALGEMVEEREAYRNAAPAASADPVDRRCGCGHHRCHLPAGQQLPALRPRSISASASSSRQASSFMCVQGVSQGLSSVDCLGPTLTCVFASEAAQLCGRWL